MISYGISSFAVKRRVYPGRSRSTQWSEQREMSRKKGKNKEKCGGDGQAVCRDGGDGGGEREGGRWATTTARQLSNAAAATCRVTPCHPRSHAHPCTPCTHNVVLHPARCCPHIIYQYRCSPHLALCTNTPTSPSILSSPKDSSLKIHLSDSKWSHVHHEPLISVKLGTAPASANS